MKHFSMILLVMLAMLVGVILPRQAKADSPCLECQKWAITHQALPTPRQTAEPPLACPCGVGCPCGHKPVLHLVGAAAAVTERMRHRVTHPFGGRFRR